MRRLKINLPGPRWLQFIVIVLLADLLIFAIVAGSCASGRCSTVDWSNRMFWGGMAAFGIGIPSVGASLMGLAGSSGVGDNPLAMGMEAAVMNDVIRYEQGARAKRMKFFWWFFAIGAGAVLISVLISQITTQSAGGPPDFSSPQNALPAKVTSQFVEDVERSVNYIPLSGVTVAVWDGKGQVFVNGYGTGSADPNTRYAIGGLTEQFTAVAVMQLVESGDLALEGLITAYVPELPDSYGFITLKHLLSHTSGLPGDDDVWEALVAALGDDPWQSDVTYTAADFLALSEAVFPEPRTKPGTAYHHSEQGYRILGIIIEAASGESYNDYMASHLLTPAGLAATAPCEIDGSNLAQGHRVENGAILETSLPNTSFAYAAGNLCSSAADLVQWQYALASHQLIGADMLKTLYLPVANKQGELIKVGTDDLAGLGNSIGQITAAGTFSRNEGSLPGYEALMHYYHTSGLTMIILSDTQVPEYRKKNDVGISRIADQLVWTMNDNFLLD